MCCGQSRKQLLRVLTFSAVVLASYCAATSPSLLTFEEQSYRSAAAAAAPVGKFDNQGESLLL